MDMQKTLIKYEKDKLLKELKQRVKRFIVYNIRFTYVLYKDTPVYEKEKSFAKKIYGYIFKIHKKMILEDAPLIHEISSLYELSEKSIDDFIKALQKTIDIDSGEHILECAQATEAYHSTFKKSLKEIFSIKDEEGLELSYFTDYVIDQCYIEAVLFIQKKHDISTDDFEREFKSNFKHILMGLLILRNAHHRQSKISLNFENQIIKERIKKDGGFYLKLLLGWGSQSKIVRNNLKDFEDSVSMIQKAIDSFHILKDKESLNIAINLLKYRVLKDVEEHVERKKELDRAFFRRINKHLALIYVDVLDINIDVIKGRFKAVSDIMSTFFWRNLAQLPVLTAEKDEDKDAIYTLVTTHITVHLTTLVVCHQYHKQQQTIH